MEIHTSLVYHCSLRVRTLGNLPPSPHHNIHTLYYNQDNVLNYVFQPPWVFLSPGMCLGRDAIECSVKQHS